MIKDQLSVHDLSCGSGIVPDLTFMSVIAGAFVLGVNVTAAWLLVERSKMPAWGWRPLVLSIGAALDYGLFAAIQQQVRKLRLPVKK